MGHVKPSWHIAPNKATRLWDMNSVFAGTKPLPSALEKKTLLSSSLGDLC